MGLGAMKTESDPGPLVVIGGAEEKQGDCAVLSTFLRLAGGPEARIVVLTVASEEPHVVGPTYSSTFERLGAASVEVVDIESRDEAHQAAGAIEQATGVFFTGGDQRRIATLLGGTAADVALRRLHAGGAVSGGTSAGASAMSGNMILGGKALVSPRAGVVEVGPGLDFVPGVIIDQHFAQRGRIGRLLSAVSRYPHHLGVGIDEDTAMVVRGEEFEVVGSGSVTVVDAGSVTFDGEPEAMGRDPVALLGVKLHVLPSGFRFDLRERTAAQPLPATETEDSTNRQIQAQCEGEAYANRNGASAARSERASSSSGPSRKDRTRRSRRDRLR
jgi:cyanophycinase